METSGPTYYAADEAKAETHSKRPVEPSQSVNN